jgi:hypothetical protein
MWFEKHIEFEFNCESLVDWLRAFSPEGPEDFDETLALFADKLDSWPSSSRSPPELK